MHTCQTAPCISSKRSLLLAAPRSWESLDGWASLPADYSARDLYLPGPLHDTPHNTTRSLRLTAQLLGSPTPTVLHLTVLARQAPPMAVLNAPGGEVAADMLLLLDASGSHDPQDPQAAQGPLQVSWACWQLDNGKPCFLTVSPAGLHT